MKRPPAKLNGTASAVVKKATGRSWAEWIAVLEEAGAKSWPANEIALWLHKKHRVADAWCQKLTLGYAEASGRRIKPSKTEGFEISLSKTIGAPVALAFEAWKDAAQREKWLPGTPLTVRKATPHKSIRILWNDGTQLSVNFWPKGPFKCEVMPQHGSLAAAATAEKLKTYWHEKLDALCAFVEKKHRESLA